MNKNYDNNINVQENIVIDFTESKVSFEQLSKQKNTDSSLQTLPTDIRPDSEKKEEQNSNLALDASAELPNIPDVIVNRLTRTDGSDNSLSDISDTSVLSDASEVIGDVVSFIAEGLSGL